MVVTANGPIVRWVVWHFRSGLLLVWVYVQRWSVWFFFLVFSLLV